MDSSNLLNVTPFLPRGGAGIQPQQLAGTVQLLTTTTLHSLLEMPWVTTVHPDGGNFRRAMETRRVKSG